MTPFDSLSSLARAVFALWALLICLSDIFSAALAAVRKRFASLALAILFLAPVYFIWQVIFDVSLSRSGGEAANVSRLFGSVPAVLWAVAFAVFTFAAAVLLGFNLRYDRTFITPGTVKRFLDGIPCGVCCFTESGRVLFSNVCMNDLCLALTGAPLLNGNLFREAAGDGIVNAMGKEWRFSCRDIAPDGEILRELIASDITAEYAKTKALEEDRTELAELNGKLNEYYQSIDDAVRRQEILQAKANIHDEMNRLMLSTAAADGGDTAELDRIFSLWEKNALLLCMEADGVRTADRIGKLASALKIRLLWDGSVPDGLNDRERELFFSAANEAIVNAAKHAGAGTLKVSFEKSDSATVCRFTNDGKMPEGQISFTGGLSNLSYVAKKLGATVSANVEKEFVLTVIFPKNQPIG